MNTKRTLACAALLLGLLSFNAPLTAAVESDIVGYTTITTNPGFNMQGVVFQGLASETTTLDELLSGDFQTGDEVQVYANGAYTIYQYLTGTGWMMGRKPASQVPVKAGDSFWLKTPERSIEVTFKGAVKKGDFRYVAGAGSQMVSADIPVAFALNDDTGSVTWANVKTGDQIQVLTATGGYQIYTYSQSTGKWLEGRVPTTLKVPVGSSIWLNVQEAGASLQVANPVK